MYTKFVKRFKYAERVKKFCNHCKQCTFLWFTVILITLPVSVYAGDEDSRVDLNKIVVNSSDISDWTATYSSRDITSDDISVSPAANVEDLFEISPFVDVLRAGCGVQTDFSLHGGDFEQTLLMIDGIPMTDSQTGHYTADVPITLDTIERVRVVNSASSHFYGSGAFSGAINIVPGLSSLEKNIVSFSAGNHQLRTSALSMGLTKDVEYLDTIMSFEHQSSSGWYQDTDFDINNFSLSCATSRVKGFFSVKKKHYGISERYSNLFPHQEDNTQTEFFYLKGILPAGLYSITPKVYFRRHSSEYFLDRNNPDFFSNTSTDYSTGHILTLERDAGNSAFRCGVDISREWIESTNLGDHGRDHGAVFTGIKTEVIEGVVVDLNGRMDYYQKFEYIPSAGISVDIRNLPFSNAALLFSVSSGFRVPSFTELYYDSPGNSGNEFLKPEKAVETGITFSKLFESLKTEISMFRRRGDNLIDWVRNDDLSVWQVDNISQSASEGSEIVLTYLSGLSFGFLNLDSLSGGYRYIYSEKKNDFIYSKYVYNYLRHKAFLRMHFLFPERFELNATAKYEERVDRRPVWWVDLKLSKAFEVKKHCGEFFISVKNVLDDAYEDSDGIPVPGRWGNTGVRIEF